jgi:hypothetical protein
MNNILLKQNKNLDYWRTRSCEVVSAKKWTKTIPNPEKKIQKPRKLNMINIQPDRKKCIKSPENVLNLATKA